LLGGKRRPDSGKRGGRQNTGHPPTSSASVGGVISQKRKEREKSGRKIRPTTKKRSRGGLEGEKRYPRLPAETPLMGRGGGSDGFRAGVGRLGLEEKWGQLTSGGAISF